MKNDDLQHTKMDEEEEALAVCRHFDNRVCEDVQRKRKPIDDECIWEHLTILQQLAAQWQFNIIYAVPIEQIIKV